MSKQDDEVTKVTCPVCNGEGMLLKERGGSYHGSRCWLCSGGKVIHPDVFKRWIAAGRPMNAP